MGQLVAPLLAVFAVIFFLYLHVFSAFRLYAFHGKVCNECPFFYYYYYKRDIKNQCVLHA